MVAVLDDHLPGILNRLLFPVAVAKVLPAGNLCKDQQTQSVACVNKGMGLRIMAGSDRIDTKLLLEDSCVFHLQRVRYRIAAVRIALMAVESA